MQPAIALQKPHTWRTTVTELSELVEDLKPDIVHSHFVQTTLAMRIALRRSGIPRVFQVPGPLHLEKFLTRRIELATATNVDYWIGSCNWTVDRYRRSGIAEARLFMSHYGSDGSHDRPNPGGKLRREIGLSDQAQLVGMVAFMYAPKRLMGQRRGLKGHEDLIDAVALLREDFPDLRCVFIGGAWDGAENYERSIREFAHNKIGDRGIFLGTRSDVRELYPDLDIAVHPSHSENLGAAAESLLNEVPTVASNVGGFPDVVRPGETGWLVPPKSPPAIAAAIKEVLEDQPAALATAVAGRELCADLLDVRRTASEVLAIYEDILRRSESSVTVVRHVCGF